MRKIMLRAAAVAAGVVLLGVGFNAGPAQARDIEIGPIEVCSTVTFFDNVIFTYDCHIH